MAKIYQILLALSVVVLAVILFYKFAGQNAVNKEVIKQQEKQIEIQHETIEVKKFQQRIISKTAVNVDAAARRKFLLFVFKERANPNG
jgi:hypothetical protein